MSRFSRKDDPVLDLVTVDARIESKKLYIRNLTSITSQDVNDPTGKYQTRRREIQRRIEVAQEELEQLDATYTQTHALLAQAEAELAELQKKRVLSVNKADIMKMLKMQEEMAKQQTKIGKSA